MREIFLQKLVYNEESGDVSSSAELPTKPRICDLQDTQDAYDFLQKKNKDKIKEPAKVLTFSNNKVHYLNKILILQVKTKLSVGTIHYSSQNFTIHLQSRQNTAHAQYARTNFSKVPQCK